MIQRLDAVDHRLQFGRARAGSLQVDGFRQCVGHGRGIVRETALARIKECLRALDRGFGTIGIGFGVVAERVDRLGHATAQRLAKAVGQPQSEQSK